MERSLLVREWLISSDPFSILAWRRHIATSRKVHKSKGVRRKHGWREESAVARSQSIEWESWEAKSEILSRWQLFPHSLQYSSLPICVQWWLIGGLKLTLEGIFTQKLQIKVLHIVVKTFTRARLCQPTCLGSQGPVPLGKEWLQEFLLLSCQSYYCVLRGWLISVSCVERELLATWA